MGIFNSVTIGYREPVWVDFITALGMRKVFEAVEPTTAKSS